jgi:hypothetical protein
VVLTSARHTPERCSGLLTQGGLMATLAHEEEPSQVYRGNPLTELLA